MKRHNIFTTLTAGLALLMLLSLPLAGCDNRPDNEILPPVEEPEEPDPEPDPEPKPDDVLFVKVDGAGKGDGSSWDDAMSASDLAESLKNGYIDEDYVICMAAGTYKMDSHGNGEFRVKKSLTFQGGYPADITGDVTAITYPSEHRTVISGDRNGDGVPNSGDVRSLSVRSTDNQTTHAVFKGLDITCGYVGDWPGGGMSVEGAAAIAELHYCRIFGNVSEVEEAVRGGGGGVCIKSGGRLYAYKSEITGNKSKTRGGGIAFLDASSGLYLESCLISGNETGQFGSAIHKFGSSGGIYIANSTITGNVITNGGGAINISASDNGGVVIISSTIAGNIEKGSLDQGIDIRCENNMVSMINSVVTNSTADRYSLFAAADRTVTSGGGNVIGNHTSETFAAVASDNTGKAFSGVFASDQLADNGGYPQTLLPKGIYTGSSVAEIVSFYSEKVSGIFEFDVTVDQRGVARNADAAVPGACGAVEGGSQGEVGTDPVGDVELPDDGWYGTDRATVGTTPVEEESLSGKW